MATERFKIADIEQLNKAMPGNQELHQQQPQEHTESREENQQAKRRLKWLLQLYFFHPIKWTDNSISFHFGKIALFFLQLTKVILITVMMFGFGGHRQHFDQIVNDGRISLRNLFMEGWDASWETMPYPPAHGEFAVYEKHAMVERINYAVERYHKVQSEAIGYFVPTNDSITISMKYFDFGGFGETSEGDITIKQIDFKAEHGLVPSGGGYTYNVTKEFEYHNLTQPIKKLLSLTLTFMLNSVRVFTEQQRALCLNIKCQLTFRDLDNNGQVIEDLETTTSTVSCEVISVGVTDWKPQHISIYFVVLVTVLCGLSSVLTLAHNVFAVILYWKTKKFIKKNYQKIYQPITDQKPPEIDLPTSQYRKFFKWWDIPSIISDVITFVGTFSIATNKKYKIDDQRLDKDTILLSVGCLLAWFSLLRYFKFNNKFHLLFTTVYLALKDVIPYLFCVTILFLGFWACVYVVLGPYNVKFSSKSAAAETLLSVVNGDEIYATLAIMDNHPNLILRVFARIYIWTYVAVFTVVVLNLLVAILLNAYDVIREDHKRKVEDRDLSLLELALKDLVESDKESRFRQSVADLINSRSTMTDEEINVRTQLQTFFRQEGNDIVPRIPRTLKAFYMRKEENWRTNVEEGDNKASRKCLWIIKEFNLCCNGTGDAMNDARNTQGNGNGNGDVESGPRDGPASSIPSGNGNGEVESGPRDGPDSSIPSGNGNRDLESGPRNGPASSIPNGNGNGGVENEPGDGPASSIPSGNGNGDVANEPGDGPASSIPSGKTHL